jgi:hypothetical protein
VSARDKPGRYKSDACAAIYSAAVDLFMGGMIDRSELRDFRRSTHDDRCRTASPAPTSEAGHDQGEVPS